jgi:hypothetical protein
MEETMTDFPIEEIRAPWLVALLAKLFKYGDVPRGGGDPTPTFLTAVETEALAAEGVTLLARYLPQEAARQVASAVEHIARPPHQSREQALLSLGALGAVVPDFGDPSGARCCMVWPGRGIICTR